MKEFFKVTKLSAVLDAVSEFPRVMIEEVPLTEANGRVLAEDVVADSNLPAFPRSTVDGYAVLARSTFGASDSSPAYLVVTGEVEMGRSPSFSIGAGEACRIPTGGELPDGTDSVVMIEHAESLDETTIEIYRSVAPGQHVLEVGEDFKKDAGIVSKGHRLRPQECGLLAAFGRSLVSVYQKPVIGIISTGDEVVPIGETPAPGQIRDINTYTLSGQVLKAGGIPVSYGIVPDDYDALADACRRALDCSDIVLLSGGSSVGTRDYTIEVISALPDANIMVHGMSISPGKPTILAKTMNKSVWGLPGHAVSAMIVFKMVVLPFIEYISGIPDPDRSQSPGITARLNRNISSAQGRTDFIRVRLIRKKGDLLAEPVLGKSGLINTMVKADGLLTIDINTEGLDAGALVEVIPLYP
jgi:molybdopterin molybdotransferase